MNRQPAFNLPRACCALVLCFAWLVISNHCALGDVARCFAPTVEKGGCCAGEAVPHRGQAPAQETRECCKALNLLPQEPAAPLVAFNPANSADMLAWPSLEMWQPMPPVEMVEWLETGPPQGYSFAELVLQRSLRSHAPPALG